MQPAIICVDDEKTILDTLKEQLKFHLGGRYSVEVAESGEEALDIIEDLIKEGVDIPVVISDQIMPGLKGDELLRRIHSRLPRTRKILLTGQASAEEVGNAVNNASLYRYIGKPWDAMDMTLTVSEAIRSYFQGKDLFKKNQELEEKIQAFYKFVPVRFLEILNHEKNFEKIELGMCCECSLAVMFSDIRSFSMISDNISPEENFRFLNSYLANMGPIIRKHSGFIDKYIGDGIMGLFENADQAVQAGIDMLNHLSTYNEGRKRAGYIPINVGVGINNGNLMLGTIGESHRMETTVIGDVVNLASRIEGLTKVYGTPMIISEYTMKSLKDTEKYAIRFIDRTKVKGKEIPVKVFEVFNADIPEMYDKKIETMKLFENAVSLYHYREFEDALVKFREYVKKNPCDKVAYVYIRRCESIINFFAADYSSH